MDRLIETIHQDLKYIREKMDELTKSTATHGAQLKEHIRRQDVIEDKVEEIERNLEPIKTHVAIVNAIGKGFLIVLSGGASVAAIIRVLKGLS